MWLNGKESTCSSTPGSKGSPGNRNGSPLQYSCLENPTDRGAWRAAVHGVARSRTRLSYRAQPQLVVIAFWETTCFCCCCFSVMSDSLQPHGLQYVRSLFKPMSIESTMPSNHLIFCLPTLLPAIFPSTRETTRWK